MVLTLPQPQLFSVEEILGGYIWLVYIEKFRVIGVFAKTKSSLCGLSQTLNISLGVVATDNSVIGDTS